jgi:hypothetical protein
VSDSCHTFSEITLFIGNTDVLGDANIREYSAHYIARHKAGGYLIRYLRDIPVKQNLDVELIDSLIINESLIKNTLAKLEAQQKEIDDYRKKYNITFEFVGSFGRFNKVD